MRRYVRWTLALPALALGTGCGLFSQKKAEQPPPEQKAAPQPAATDWDSRIGQSGIEAHSDRIGAASIDTLAMSGPGASPKIADYITDPSPVVRNKAVQTLAGFGREAEPAVPRLLEFLRDSDEGIRVAAAKALALIGSPSAGRGLERAEGDRSAQVRIWAHSGLAAIEGDCADHMEEAAEIFASGALASPADGAEALGRMGCANREVIQLLTTAVDRGEEDQRSAAARALGYIGPAAAEAVPSLTRALEDKSWRIRQSALLALAKMGSRAAPAVDPLAELLKDPSPRFRELAAHALGAIGPPARPAVEALRKATLDREANVQAAAKRALSSILSHPADKKP